MLQLAGAGFLCGLGGRRLERTQQRKRKGTEERAAAVVLSPPARAAVAGAVFSAAAIGQQRVGRGREVARVFGRFGSF
jgi:hypothetical protein